MDISIHDLSEDKLKDAIDRMSMSKKVEMVASLYGFASVPPTIEEFVNDEYYLGRFLGFNPDLGKKILFPYWVDVLNDIYPNPIVTKYKYIVPSGALGTGKSTLSKIMAAYDYCKMLHLTDPYSTYQLDPSTLFTIRCFNLSIVKAMDVLVNPLNEWIGYSPYFKEQIKRIEESNESNKFSQTSVGDNNLKLKILPAKKANDVISECLIFALISEVNFFKPHVADDIINTCQNRMKGRLANVEGVFGHILLDSSSTQKDSVVEKFLKENAYPDITKVIRTSIWQAKAHEGYYFNKGSFQVFIGDTTTKAHIIAPYEDTSNYDKDLIITVPEEVRPEFKSDIVKALNDLAGISLDSQNDFIPDKDPIHKNACLPMDFDDEIVLDFFDDEQIYDRIGDKILSLLPKDRKLYCRTDLGLVTDRCGMAICYADGANYIEVNKKKVYRPNVKVPVAFALSRKPGQETSIEKIINFWIWLSTKRDVAIVSTDQYQSAGIRQELTKNKITAKLLSVDRTDVAYTEFKGLLLQDRVQMPKSDLLVFELVNLVRTDKNKIDHKPAELGYHKDICDAMVGAIHTLLEAGEESCDVSNIDVVDKLNVSISKLAEANRKKAILAQLTGMYGYR